MKDLKKEMEKLKMGTSSEVKFFLSAEKTTFAFDVGFISKYYKNRATGTISIPRATEYANNLCLHSINTISLGLSEDGESLVIADGHHRLTALSIVDKTRGFTEKEKNYPITISIVTHEEFIEKYIRSNDHKPHSQGVKISNTDLAAGYALNNLLEHAMAKNGNKYENPIKQGQLQVIFDTIVASWNDKDEMTLESLMKARSLISKEKMPDRAHKTNPLRFSNNTKRTLINALSFYLLLREEFDKQKDVWTQGDTRYNLINTALCSSGFMSILMIDAFSLQPKIISKSPKSIITSISKNRNIVRFSDSCKVIGRRNGPMLRTLRPWEEILDILS
jgi:hypothetical protein